ncbi:MAG: energy transducer TonB [Thiovulaceae bacterium]|nr:energy transducer TonB [Sulfurimonadaceae bacterium]
MLKKSIAFSTALHVAIGAVVVYFMFVTHTPPKPKVIPITIMTLPSTPKTKPSPSKVQPVQKLQPPKELVKQKPVVQDTKPTPIALPKPLPKPVEEKLVEKPKELVKPVEPALKAPKSEPKITGVDTKNIKSKYLGALYQSIDKLKVYPKNAKRLGQSGTAKVTFTVLADGTITNISINGGSGFEMLDDAAKKILITLAKTAPIPKELKEESMTITVPVVYTID